MKRVSLLILKCLILTRIELWESPHLYQAVIKVLENLDPGKVAYIWKIGQVQVDTIKFERKQIHVFSNVFTAVVVVIAKARYWLSTYL